MSIGPLRTNFSEILIKIQNFSFRKIYIKIPSVKWRPFCPGEDELTIESYNLKHVKMFTFIALEIQWWERTRIGTIELTGSGTWCTELHVWVLL